MKREKCFSFISRIIQNDPLNGFLCFQKDGKVQTSAGKSNKLDRLKLTQIIHYFPKKNQRFTFNHICSFYDVLTQAQTNKQN